MKNFTNQNQLPFFTARKTKLSLSRFYLSNIILYTCLLAFPLSAAIEQVSQTEHSKPSNTLTTDSADQSLGGVQTESKEQEEEKKEEPKQESISNQWLSLAKKGDQDNARKLRSQYQISSYPSKDKNGNNALQIDCRYSENKAMILWLLNECKVLIERRGTSTPFPLRCTRRTSLHSRMTKRTRG